MANRKQEQASLEEIYLELITSGNFSESEVEEKIERILWYRALDSVDNDFARMMLQQYRVDSGVTAHQEQQSIKGGISDILQGNVPDGVEVETYYIDSEDDVGEFLNKGNKGIVPDDTVKKEEFLEIKKEVKDIRNELNDVLIDKHLYDTTKLFASKNTNENKGTKKKTQNNKNNNNNQSKKDD